MRRGDLVPGLAVGDLPGQVAVDDPAAEYVRRLSPDGWIGAPLLAADADLDQCGQGLEPNAGRRGERLRGLPCAQGGAGIDTPDRFAGQATGGERGLVAAELGQWRAGQGPGDLGRDVLRLAVPHAPHPYPATRPTGLSHSTAGVW